MPTKPAEDPKVALLKLLVTALEGKKADELRVLDVSKQSTITDYLVLANGNSEPHLRALRIEVERVLDAAHVQIAGMDGGGYGSGWTVVDAYQIMVHLFTPGQRTHYALENLWKDAQPLDLKTLQPIAPPKPKVAKAVRARPRPATKQVKKKPRGKK